VRIIAWFLFILAFAYGFYWLNALWIQGRGGSLIASDVKQLEQYKVLVVPGAGRAYSERRNYQFDGRVKTAAYLSKQLQPEFIILSGFHDGGEYSETLDLAKGLTEQGVDPQLFVYDSTAHDTFQTILNLRQLAGTKQMVITSQKKHLSRLLWTASQCDLKVAGYEAEGWPGGTPQYINVRERMACMKARIDVLMYAITGKRISLPEKSKV
jgi:vancomycin permeability regulator SanA